MIKYVMAQPTNSVNPNKAQMSEVELMMREEADLQDEKATEMVANYQKGSGDIGFAYLQASIIQV